LLLLFALPMPLYGWSGTIDLHEIWWKTVTETTVPNLLNPDNVSLASMYAKWLGIGALSATLATVSALVLMIGAAIVFVRRRLVSAPEGLEGSLLLLLIPLLSPQGWDYVLLIATPAIIYLANYHDLLPARWRALTVVARGVPPPKWLDRPPEIPVVKAVGAGHLRELRYEYTEETANPAYRMFLS